MNFSSLSLPVCNMAFPSQINVDRIELFTLKATAASQLSQRMLGFNVQNAFEFGSSVACLRLLHEGFGCVQQVAEARKPHRPIIPKALGVKPCNGFQRVVLSSMRIAAQILQLCQLAKDRTARWIAERCLDLIKGSDLLVIKELLEGLNLVSCCVHNETISPYKKLCQGQCSQKQFSIRYLYILHRLQ